MIEPMSADRLAKLVGRCKTFFPTEELDKVVFRGVDDLLTDGELAMLSGAGYFLPDKDEPTLTSEARAYLKKKYPTEMMKVADKAKREAGDIGDYDPDWLGYNPDEFENYLTKRRRESVRSYIDADILFVDKKGRYQLTEKGYDKTGYWLRHALTARCQFSQDVATGILELIGCKKGKEGDAPWTTPTKWARTLNNIRKSLSVEEKRSLGMFKEAPELTDVEKRLKHMILQQGSINPYNKQ